MSQDQRQVVEQARRGDREAFGELVRLHQDRVLRIACRMMGNMEDAKDVAQEAFIRAYQGLSGFDANSEFFTWLYRIVVNVSLNQLQRRKRQRTVSLADAELPVVTSDEARQDPRRSLELKQMMHDLHQALETLPPTIRATVVLVIQEQLSYQMSAEILGCSTGTVAWRIHEARQKLRQQLAQYLGSPSETEKNDDVSGCPAKTIDARR